MPACVASERPWSGIRAAKSVTAWSCPSSSSPASPSGAPCAANASSLRSGSILSRPMCPLACACTGRQRPRGGVSERGEGPRCASHRTARVCAVAIWAHACGRRRTASASSGSEPELRPRCAPWMSRSGAAGAVESQSTKRSGHASRCSLPADTDAAPDSARPGRTKGEWRCMHRRQARPPRRGCGGCARKTKT